jgi:hypothetical protein
MYVKCRQDNLHRMTWYIGTCGSNGHGLTIHVSFIVKCVCYTIHVSFIVKCVCYTGLWIYWFRDHGATIPNGSVTIGRMSLVGVGHLKSNSIVPLMLRTICYAMARVLTLYYRSIGTTSTLLRIGNISSITFTYGLPKILLILNKVNTIPRNL